MARVLLTQRAFEQLHAEVYSLRRSFRSMVSRFRAVRIHTQQHGASMFLCVTPSAGIDAATWDEDGGTASKGLLETEKATCDVLEHIGGATPDDFEVDDKTLEVHNFLTRPIAGKLVIAVVQEITSGLWMAVEIDEYDRVRGDTTGAVATSSVTFTIDNVVATRGRSPLDDPTSTTETLTVENLFCWEIDADEPVFAEYHQIDEKWYAYQAKCPAG